MKKRSAMRCGKRLRPGGFSGRTFSLPQNCGTPIIVLSGQTAFDASRGRLQVDCVDCYLIHTPFAFRPGDEQDPRDERGQVICDSGVREAIVSLTETWRRWGHEIGFGIGIAHGFATLGTIGFEGRFDYAAIGTVSNVASRLCDEAKPGQILISPRVLTKVEDVVKVEPVGEFELKGSDAPWRRTTYFRQLLGTFRPFW
jgi:hypothetical protein